MASELRATVLESDDIESEEITIDQWGVTLLVKGMSGGDRAKFIKRSSRGGEVDLERFYPEVVIATCFDPANPDEKVFEPADRDALSAKSGAALEQVATMALRLSGMTQTAVKDEVESLREAPSEGSTSN